MVFTFAVCLFICLPAVIVVEGFRSSASFHKRSAHHSCRLFPVRRLLKAPPLWSTQEENEYPTVPNPEDADYYEMEQTEEILEQMRKERQTDNDRWQSMLFKNQEGSFSGSYEIYEALVRDDQSIGLLRRDEGEVLMTLLTEEKKPLGLKLSVQERFQSGRVDPSLDGTLKKNLLEGKVAELMPIDLRLARGNQIIGNAFTFVHSHPSPSSSSSSMLSEEAYVAEIGIREGPIRVRVRYAYSKGGTY